MKSLETSRLSQTLRETIINKDNYDFKIIKDDEVIFANDDCFTIGDKIAVCLPEHNPFNPGTVQ